MEHPLFEIVTTTAGAVSIRNKEIGEIMHNPVGPWLEANALYIEPSRLRSRLREAAHDALVVFDVGLGAAANALAALHCAREGASQRALHLISFERELELLRYALLHADKFAHFAGYEEIVHTLLHKGRWEGGSVKWELRHGDFLTELAVERERPHLIFFDPYSAKVNRDMWSTTGFRRLRQQAREFSEGGTCLYTYSQATPVRVALLAGGFYVGHGPSTGQKEETTQAATDLRLLDKPLGPTWFERWRKSGKQFPFEAEPREERALREFMHSHPQFTGCSQEPFQP